MKTGHQMQRMAGVKLQQTCGPLVVSIRSPFARSTRAVLSTSHNDHIDVNVAAAVMQNCRRRTVYRRNLRRSVDGLGRSKKEHTA